MRAHQHESIGPLVTHAEPHRKRRLRGATSVELALVFPLLMAIFFSVLEWSFILYDKAVITSAAREGARAGIVLRSPRLTKEEIEAIAMMHCNGKLVAIHGSVECSAVANGAKANPNFGDPLEVTTNYTYSGTALLALFSILTGPITLTQTVVMTYE